MYTQSPKENSLHCKANRDTTNPFITVVVRDRCYMYRKQYENYIIWNNINDKASCYLFEKERVNIFHLTAR